MLTPESPIHLHAAIGQAAREPVIPMLPADAKIIGPAERGHDQHRIDRPSPPIHVRRRRLLFLLSPPLPPQFRHDFLYHDGTSRVLSETTQSQPQYTAVPEGRPTSTTRLPSTPTATHQSPHTAPLTPPRPPLHRSARRDQTQLAASYDSPPTDASHAFRHTIRPDSAPAPPVQSVPSARNQSARRRSPPPARSSSSRP